MVLSHNFVKYFIELFNRKVGFLTKNRTYDSVCVLFNIFGYLN